jgi:hypothetical protein
MSQFTLTEKILVDGFEGYGAQLNQNVFTTLTRDLGVTERHLKQLHRMVHQLAPRLVRIFFDPRARHGRVATSDDLMQSFEKTVELAQCTASTINITWTGGDTQDPDGTMKSFVDVLEDLVHNHGATKLRWVTIGNEPNSTKIDRNHYTALYRALHDQLEKRGLEDRIGLMGGDLVRAKNQEQWFQHLAENMSDLLGAWSIHVYWKYDDLGSAKSPPKLEERLREVLGFWNDYRETQRKPLYVTEYGVRGAWKVKRDVPQPDGTVKKKWVILKPEPGTYKPQDPDLNGPRIVDQNITAFQHAWFNLLAANLGYHGLVKWDAYFGKYDLQFEQHPQEYGLLGKPDSSGWRPRPSYDLMRLFTQTVEPGWNVRELTTDDSGTELVAAYSAPSGPGLTLIGLDTAGARLNEKVPDQRTYHFSKLPGNTSFELLYWNRHGRGLLTSAGTKQTDGGGNLPGEAPLHSVFALTTVAVDM